MSTNEIDLTSYFKLLKSQRTKSEYLQTLFKIKQESKEYRLQTITEAVTKEILKTQKEIENDN